MCSDGRWLTTTELKEYHGISRSTIYRHVGDIEEQGLARRTYPCQPGQGSNPWLFHPDVIEILKDSKPGRPRLDPTEEQRLILSERNSRSIEQLRKDLGVSWHTAKRWQEDAKQS